ncbi:MAG TPA: GAF domain-containing protein [Anaerolineae bacterium]|nr:GAF domain-containing protein [Anaerolineae bacterium]
MSSLDQEQKPLTHRRQATRPETEHSAESGSEQGPVVEGTEALAQANELLRQEVRRRKQVEEALRQAIAEAESARRAEQERRREAERRRRIAENLSGVLIVLNAGRPLEEVLDYIAVQAGRLLDARGAGIYRLEEDGSLVVRATQGVLLAYVDGVDLPVGKEALMEAIARRQPVPVSNLVSAVTNRPVEAERRLHATAWLDIYRAALAVPIIVQGRPYGGMLLYYGQPRHFSAEELDVAATFGAQIALAIENARLREQVRQAATAAERERLARELHDAVTQTLFSASLIAEALPRIWERDPEQGRQGLEELRRLTQGAVAEMRTLLIELRPAALTEKPLSELLRHLTEAMAGRMRLPIFLTSKGDYLLNPDVQIALYRIAQEALNNVAQHARASRVTVEWTCRPEWARLVIADDGDGFHAEAVQPDHFGTRIMRERAAEIGAGLEIVGVPGRGTTVIVRWPEEQRE